MHSILLCVLTSTTVCRGFEANGTEAVKLPAPSIYGWSHIVVDSRSIHWFPLNEEEHRGYEPVLGYKVKMWEVGCVTKRKVVVVDGREKQVEERVMPELLDFSTLRNLQEFTLEGVENSDFFLYGHRKDVPYHLTVAAYGASGVGPFSPPMRFQEEGEYKCREF